ncbi:MAG: hypothetical protein U9R38_02060 [Candidatus Margulisiibacteriota bacterium]|nr:hypothetical protein [Candidatus Margulisiibacteriota bacterium]
MRKSLFLIAVCLIISSPLWAATQTVTNCADSGNGSLRQAITDAGSGDIIDFNITTIEAGISTGETYSGWVTNEAADAQWFRIVLDTTLTVNTDNITIEGSSQPTDEANNPYGPEVEIRSPGNIAIAVSGSGVKIDSLVVNNSQTGININGNNNKVTGCFIGTCATGESDKGNSIYGIFIFSDNNRIGGLAPSERNIISGNNSYGIKISDNSSNEVLGNYIGFGIDGETVIANGLNGILLEGSSSHNLIGTSESGGKNIIIAGTTTNASGIAFSGSDVTGNYVYNNTIGLTSNGSLPATRGKYGILFQDASHHNYIGGTNTGEANIISGNSSDGIYITGSGTSSNEVLGNYIGTDSSGALDCGNGLNGITISNGASQNKIGNGTSNGRNIISGNDRRGVEINGTGTDHNQILGNYIGTDVNGTSSLTNESSAVYIEGGAKYNKIGNGASGGRNICSGNAYGIYMRGTGTNSNEVLGNYIGTDKTGTTALPNTVQGVTFFLGASYNMLGGATPAPGTGNGNVISGNKSYGVYMGGSATIGNRVLGNLIGTNYNGASAIPNGSSASTDGVHINGSPHNQIGDGTADGRNIISGNAGSGICIKSTSACSNEISENYIGTDINGTSDLGNAVHGIYIYNSSSFNQIGPGNTIAFNTDGVRVDGASTTKEVITQNSIFSNSGKGIAIVNSANPGASIPLIFSAIRDPSSGQNQITGEGAPALGTVELFKAEGDQGKTYLGSTTADISGKWSITMSSLATGDAVVTTGTTANPETSEFSSPEVVVEGIIPTPSDLDSFNANAPSSAIQGSSFSTTVTALNSQGSVETNVIGTTQLLVDNGTITPESIAESSFTNGVWTGDISLGEIGARTITVSNEGSIGAASVLVLNATIELTSTDLGIAGMSITIPAGAASAEVNITASEVASPGSPRPGFSIGGTIVDIDSTVTNFLLPVTVTMPINGPLADPRVYYWNGTEWSSDGITIVETTDTYITFTTTHFTIFAPMGAIASNLVRFGPNPYNPNSGTPAKIWYWLTADTATSIYIVDMSGTLVWKNSYAAGSNGGRADSNDIDFNGKDRWGNILGDGVYIYKIVQGGKSIGGGKIAIIK